jgi:hypothetical protein
VDVNGVSRRWSEETNKGQIRVVTWKVVERETERRSRKAEKENIIIR